MPNIHVEGSHGVYESRLTTLSQPHDVSVSCRHGVFQSMAGGSPDGDVDFDYKSVAAATLHAATHQNHGADVLSMCLRICAKV